MSDIIVDDFYTARNLLYLGAYPQALSNLTLHTHISAGSDSAIERDSIQYRTLLAQGNPNAVLEGIPPSSNSPTLLAVRALAQLRVAETSGDARGKEAAVSAVQSLIEDKASLAANPTLTAIAAQVLSQAQKYDEALKILVVHSKNLECVLQTVLVYLAIGRVDLAEKLVARVRTWSEDAPIAQLAEAFTFLYVGGPKYTEAYYIFEELSQAASVSTVRILNSTAVSKLHLAQYVEAEGILEEALVMDSDDRDTLANMYICAVLSGKPSDVKDRYLGQLRSVAPNHVLLADIREKEREFDAAAAKYSI